MSCRGLFIPPIYALDSPSEFISHHPMYRWRKMTAEERERTLAWRREWKIPLHSPRHVDSGRRSYLITAACYEHAAIIGHSIARLDHFARDLMALVQQHSSDISAWVVLPNHYHVLASLHDVKHLLAALGRFHGRTSFTWNGEEDTRGRRVWFNAVETVMKSDRHLFASQNYVHHNAIRHGYADRWQDWPWSSASEFLSSVSEEEARQRWVDYPVGTMGEGWDD